MFAERRIQARTASPPSPKARGSNSRCRAAPATLMPSGVAAASAGGAPSARCATAAAAAAVPAGEARCINGPSARRLPEQHAPGLLGEGGPGVGGRVDRGGLLVGAHGGRTVVEGLEPALEIREIIEILSLRLVRHDPRVGRDVGDRELAGDERALGETLVQHPVQAVRLLDVALDGVRNRLWCIADEVMVLSGHGPKARDRKSTRLNSSHITISYAVFCL